MPIEPIVWTPFPSDTARLEYLKEHKLTPKTFKEPKQLFYSGIDAEGTQPCTVEGFVDDFTAVIALGDKYHCIHPDHLLEMQSKKSPNRRTSTQKPAPAPTVPKPTNSVDFVAIDFETATANTNSACALGIAVVRNLEIAETWYHLIQPPNNRYEESTIYIHGITPAQTEHEQPFDAFWNDIKHFFTEDTLILAHNARFDISVLRNSLSNEKLIPNFQYADTLTMVKGVVDGRHGLDACCDFFGIDLQNHHNALDDAIACANVAMCCVKYAGCNTFQDYVKQISLQKNNFRPRQKRANPYAAKAVKLSEISATVEQFDFTHPLYQKNVVFTGDLTIERAQAVQLAVNKGAIVKSGVSAKTHIVVIGTHGQSANAPMSSKETRARELIAAGKDLRLMYEDEFLKLVQG